MEHNLHVNLVELVLSASRAIDLISPEVANHHARVAYIALQIASELQLPKATKQDIVLSGLLHDIGILSSSEQSRVMVFDGDPSSDHGVVGSLLLSKFHHFHNVADIVCHHHSSWSESSATNIPYESHILHLADRISVLIKDETAGVLNQVEEITAAITRKSGSQFDPKLVDIFVGLSDRESFWLDIISTNLDRKLSAQIKSMGIELEWREFSRFSEILAHVIDFRSRFTATHSSGVAAVGEAIAGLIGLSKIECIKVRIAGYLHDIGKLAVPISILEKESRLSESEIRLMKAHVYHTARVLEQISGIEDIVQWASQHHERLDGTGYPNRHSAQAIPIESRIIAVADVFTALSEERPYRSSMAKTELIETMQQLAGQNVLDPHLVDLVINEFAEVSEHRRHAQDMASMEYKVFREFLPMSELLHSA